MSDRVLIMSQGPGRIYDEMNIKLPFPRNRNTSEFNQLRDTLMRQFGDSGNASTESRIKPLYRSKKAVTA